MIRASRMKRTGAISAALVVVVGTGAAGAAPASASGDFTRPEPNNFACPFAPANPGVGDACNYYGRGDFKYRLLIGTNSFGFRHIRMKRGFSKKTNYYISSTLKGGRRENEGGGSFRFTADYYTHGVGCTVRVVYSSSKDSIITAYTINDFEKSDSKKGYFFFCP